MPPSRTKMDVQANQITAKDHHKKREVCLSRATYREGRDPKAVKVYTVAQESQYLLIQGVPALGAQQELIKLLALYGAVSEYNVLHEYPGEKFTETYLIKFTRIQSARVAKKKLDDTNFYGGSIHICYAPEFESVDETRDKLSQRRKAVARRLREIDAETGDKNKVLSTSESQETTSAQNQSSSDLSRIMGDEVTSQTPQDEQNTHSSLTSPVPVSGHVLFHQHHSYNSSHTYNPSQHRFTTPQLPYPPLHMHNALPPPPPPPPSTTSLPSNSLQIPMVPPQFRAPSFHRAPYHMSHQYPLHQNYPTTQGQDISASYPSQLPDTQGSSHTSPPPPPDSPSPLPDTPSTSDQKNNTIIKPYEAKRGGNMSRFIPRQVAKCKVEFSINQDNGKAIRRSTPVHTSHTSYQRSSPSVLQGNKSNNETLKRNAMTLSGTEAGPHRPTDSGEEPSSKRQRMLGNLSVDKTMEAIRERVRQFSAKAIPIQVLKKQKSKHK